MSHNFWIQLTFADRYYDRMREILGSWEMEWLEDPGYEVIAEESPCHLQTVAGDLDFDLETIMTIRQTGIPFVGWGNDPEYGSYCFAYDGKTYMELTADLDGLPIVVVTTEGVSLKDIEQGITFCELRERARARMREEGNTNAD